MFGIGFTEILLISVIAILFLGPDKLPEAMIQIAKFIKSVKKTVDTAKSSLDEELKIGDLKEEALNYKKQLDSATSELKSFKNIDFDDITRSSTGAMIEWQSPFGPVDLIFAYPLDDEHGDDTSVFEFSMGTKF